MYYTCNTRKSTTHGTLGYVYRVNMLILMTGFLQLHGKTIQGLFQDFPGVQIQFSRAASVLFVY